MKRSLLPPAIAGLVGVALVVAGVALQFGVPWALIVAGLPLVVVALLWERA